MKRFFLIAFSFLLSFLTMSQTRLEWYSNFKADTIEYVGSKQLFKQLCTNDADSLLINGEAIFMNAYLENVGDCRIHRFYKDTIYQKTIIELKDKENYDSLFNFFKALSQNSFSISEINKNMIYMSKFKSNEGNILIAYLITDKRKKNTVLIIE